MNKSGIKKILIIGSLVVILCLIWLLNNQKSNEQENKFNDSNALEEQTSNTLDQPNDNLNKGKKEMDLVVYLQDKQAAITTDCGVTYKKIIQIPKTIAVADASLRYLFSDELAQYGDYQSLVIQDKVARITLTDKSNSDNNDSTARKISSLSSCEARHLFAVLIDTLTQYDSVDSVELYSQSGKIEF